MATNWQNLGFVAKFLMKFALFDERKMAFLGAKSFGAYLFWLFCLTVKPIAYIQRNERNAMNTTQQ